MILLVDILGLSRILVTVRENGRRVLYKQDARLRYLENVTTIGSCHSLSLSYVTVITERVVCSPLFRAGGNVAKPEGVISAFCLVYLTGVHHC